MSMFKFSTVCMTYYFGLTDGFRSYLSKQLCPRCLTNLCLVIKREIERCSE